MTQMLHNPIAHRLHNPIVNRMPWADAENCDPKQLLEREWLVTNGLGGYASGTVSGIATRRYHGLLIAALPAPLGRMMLFNHLVEHLRLADGNVVLLGGDHTPDETEAEGIARNLASFSLEFGLPVWRYEIGAAVLEKRLMMPHRANTVHVIYRLLSGSEPLRLQLRPGLHFRAHEAPVGEPDTGTYSIHAQGDRVEITTTSNLSLKLQLREHEGAMVLDGGRLYGVDYGLEEHRGYPFRDKLWSPGHFVAELAVGESVVLSASTESWDALEATEPHSALTIELERRARLIEQADPAARNDLGAELVLAADQFIISPSTRLADEARARAAGDEARSVIAGYHWFTDWGRDTMISLEGLTLSTGRVTEAGYILRTFGQHVCDGLIPNLFPEGEQAGLYHTADATLWYFHALDRYLAQSGDVQTLRMLLPKLQDIVEHHLAGTRFGIGVDPNDGLLRQGAEGYQLTWMDAKVGDWVVTPRRGKAVEINALWYNALRLMERWLKEQKDTSAASAIGKHADRACHSFNARFWCEERGWLYDVIDGEGPDDASLRPNQLFAIALPHPVLAENRWPAVVDVCREQLLTPVGLRSLGPREADYKPKYSGDLRARDAAYHQGTVWGWLIGPFIDAWLKVHPSEREGAREFLLGYAPHLGEACLGSISEVFDAEPPFKPRGCISQAWSIAEVLRCWIKTAPAG
jgi:predicted glycogen debranching enzyme